MTLKPLGPVFGEWLISQPDDIIEPRGRGRPSTGEAISNADRQRKFRSVKAAKREQNIAVLDMETDPFDEKNRSPIFPFCAELYSDQFESVVIWDENPESFIDKIIKAIEGLPEPYTIYAHNGGKFDFMFFVHKLRGAVSFKGRGIMEANIGAHRLRDSFHIIPERLAAFQKEAFNYSKMKRGERRKHKAEILEYLHSDCVYLFDIVRKFVSDFGLKMSIGQAAMTQLKEHYEVEKLTDGFDAFLRQWFFGGRVDCLRGRGRFTGDYRLYDVNSMYPHVMAKYDHPIGGFAHYVLRWGTPGNNTVFIKLRCDNPKGAFVARHPVTGETTSRIESGEFFVTIWEYEIALKYNLISNVEVLLCVDCSARSNFSQFVQPLYAKRLETKSLLNVLKREGAEASQRYIDLKKDDTFYKLILNNAYGKFAQNPRNYKEHWLTDPNENPPPEWLKSLEKLPDEQRAKYLLPLHEHPLYWIWQKPAPMFNFNNVGVAASITGAARAVLLEALQHAVDPVYCDTDSIVCRELSNVPIHKTELGAWDLEDEFSEILILGKKLYSPRYKSAKKRTPEQLQDGISPEYGVKSKGVSRLIWDDMEAMLRGETVETVNRAPTLTKYGTQTYIVRQVRATAPLLMKPEI